MPVADFVVFGSGPLLAHGLKPAVHDLDVVARGAAWQRARTLGAPQPAPSGHGEMVELYDSSLQIFDAWVEPGWDVDRLIDEADLIDGLRFVALPIVLSWKRRSRRPKDLADIALIEDCLKL